MSAQDGTSKQRDIWNYFDIPKMKSPGPRFSSSMTYLPSKHMIMLFGGFVYNKEELKCTRDCFLYDFEHRQWSIPPFNEEAPKEIFSGHSMSLVYGKDKKPKTILIGSPIPNTKLYVMDVDSFQWRQETTSTTKWLSLDEDGIVDAGGTSVEVEHHGFGTLVKTETVDDKVIQKKAFFPNTRSYSMTVVYKNRYIYIHGGHNNSSKQICNDLWMLDSHTMEWSKIEGTGLLPTKRFAHSGVIINDSIYMFGGSGNDNVYGELFKFNISTSEWSKVIIANNPPSPRAGHSICSYDNKLVILWGRNFEIFLNDICIVDLDENEGKILSFSKPQCRQAHSIVSIPNKGNPLMLAYGGCALQDKSPRPLAEFYALDLLALFSRAQLIPPRPLETSVHSIYSSLSGCDTDIQLKGYKIKKKRSSTLLSKKPPSTSSSAPSSSTKVSTPNQSSEFHHYLKHGAKEITNWLAKLDLARYSDCFVQEEIDMNSLASLTDSDLKDIGIDKMGPRRRILSEASNFSISSSAPAIVVENVDSNETLSLIANRLSTLTNMVNDHFLLLNEHLSSHHNPNSSTSSSSSPSSLHPSSVETPSPSHFVRQQSLKHSPNLSSSSSSESNQLSSKYASPHSPLRSSSLVSSSDLSINTSSKPSSTSSVLSHPSKSMNNGFSSSSSKYVLPHIRNSSSLQSSPLPLDFPYSNEFICNHLSSFFDNVPSSIAWTETMHTYSYY